MKRQFLSVARSSLAVIALSIALAGLTGCVSTIDGKSQAGVPFIKDTVEGRYERPFQQVWIATKDVLAFNGTLTREDVIGHVLEAKVDARTVWVRVEDVDGKITRVIVQTRTKAGGSDLELAGEIDKQIAVRLATGRLSPGGAAGLPGGTTTTTFR